MRLKILVSLLGLLALLQFSAKADLAIMPLGDSITFGAHVHDAGYRYPLFVNLTQAEIAFHYLGQNADNCLPLPYPAQWHHNGYPGATIQDLLNNLNGDVRGPAMVVPTLGGYWMTSGKPDGEAVNPDLVLLLAGTNNIIHPLGHGGTDLITMETQFTNLIGWFSKNRPGAAILIGTVLPLTRPPATQNETVIAFNTWLKTNLPNFGSKCTLVDLYSQFLKPDGSLNDHLLEDGVHPTREGYAIMAKSWADSIETVISADNLKKDSPVQFGDSFVLATDKQPSIPTIRNVLVSPAITTSGSTLAISATFSAGNNALTAPAIAYSLKDFKGNSFAGVMSPDPLVLSNLAPHAEVPINIIFKLPDKLDPEIYKLGLTETAIEGSTPMGSSVKITISKPVSQ